MVIDWLGLITEMICQIWPLGTMIFAIIETTNLHSELTSFLLLNSAAVCAHLDTGERIGRRALSMLI